MSSTTQADSTYISVQPRTILMQILEDNSVFEKENFDIEVYIKETENDPRISDPADASAAASLGYWRPLSFKREQPKIVDGILVDEQMEMCQELDSSYVEYWFSVQADSEISEGLREKVAEVIRTNSLYLQDVNSATIEPSATSFEIADIYSQVVDDSCPVECKDAE